MATPTKTLRTLLASVSVSAGSAGPATLGTGSVDLRTTLGGIVTTKITPSGTLTTGCTITVYVSGDGTNWKYFASAVSGLTSAAVYEFPFVIPDKAMYVCVQFTGHAGAAVVAEAFLQEFTSFQ